MKNTILNFDSKKVVLDGIEFEVPDYFSKDINIMEFIKTLNPLDFFVKYTVQNNITLEKISFDLYGTTDYWDILALINDIDPLVSTPYDETLVLKRHSQLQNEFFTRTYYSDWFLTRGSETELKKEIEEMFQKKFDAISEKHRFINVVIPNKMHELLRELKIQGYA